MKTIRYYNEERDIKVLGLQCEGGDGGDNE